MNPMEARLMKTAKCSNPECEFHTKDAIFSVEQLITIATHALKPGEFGPVPYGMKFFCVSCGWVWSSNINEGKGGTVSPEDDPTNHWKTRIVG